MIAVLGFFSMGDAGPACLLPTSYPLGWDQPVAKPASTRNTELLRAGRDGQCDTLRRLLTEGANADARNVGGITALMFAAQEGHDECIKVLVAGGADINRTAEDRRSSALTFAVANDQYAAARYLLEMGADTWPARAFPNLRRMAGRRNDISPTLKNLLEEYGVE